MYKYIQRKSAIKPITGSIVDTTNVDDKISNAPSINLMEQMVGAPTDSVIMYDGDEIPKGYEEVEVQFITKKVLYENSEGTKNNFTLSDNKNNYKELEITYGSLTNEGDIIMKTDILPVVEGYQLTYISTMYWTAVGTTRVLHYMISFDDELNVKIGHRNGLELNIDSGVAGTTSGNLSLKIYKITGVNY